MQWLTHQISSNKVYAKCFEHLLTMFVAVGMDRFCFVSTLKYLHLFEQCTPLTFEMAIRGGVCSLWTNDTAAAMVQYHRLVDQPQSTGLGSLYMLFADALIAKNRLEEAQVWMTRIERISHFDSPRIWMRFGDYWALKEDYAAAIGRYEQA